MLLRKAIIVLMLSMLVAAIAIASVDAASAGPNLKHLKSGTGGYVVTFGKSTGVSSQLSSQDMLISPMSVLTNTIRQSQTQWAQKTVVGNPTTIYTDIWWGYPSNSISVIIYTPDGYVLGPVYDNIDGVINGDMPISLTRSGGVSSGAYYYQIYGYQISGSQYYTFA